MSEGEVLTLETVDSTNNFLKANPQYHSRPYFCVRAVEQTAGRGRHERSWNMAKGDLAFSMLLSGASVGGALQGEQVARRASPISPAVTIVAGLALYEALQEVGLRGQRIKWPNDIYVGDLKLAGILAELIFVKEPLCIIGVGVNVAGGAHRRYPQYPSVSLDEIMEGGPSAEEVFRVVRRRLIEELKNMETPFGPAFIERWMGASGCQGEVIAAAGCKSRLTIKTLDPQGGLVCLDSALREVVLEFDEISELERKK